MNDFKLYRANGILDLELIRQMSIIYFGLGSLGSITCSMLPYPWKRTILVDPEALEKDNIERHLLGNNDIGFYKAEGVKKWLVDRDIPADSIITVIGGAQEVLDRFSDVDLAIVGVDNRKTKNDINAWCMANNIPAIYGGIFPRGTGGEVAVIPKPSEVCFSCSQEIIGANQYQGHSGDDYGLSSEELLSQNKEPKAVPALRYTVAAVAYDIASFAIQLLTKGGVKPQIVIKSFAGEDILLFPKVPEYLIQFVLNQQNLGLEPRFRIATKKTSFALHLECGEVSLSVPRWDNCPFHEKQTIQAGSI